MEQYSIDGEEVSQSPRTQVKPAGEDPPIEKVTPTRHSLKISQVTNAHLRLKGRRLKTRRRNLKAADVFSVYHFTNSGFR